MTKALYCPPLTIFHEIVILDSVKTTLNIPDNRLNELMLSGAFASKKEAVNTAIEAYLRERRIARLLEAAGTSEDFMTRKELATLRKDG